MKPTKKARVKLVGEDGNAFAILGRCLAAGRRAGYTAEQLKEFQDEATSGDYDHLLATCMEWFDEEGSFDEEDEEPIVCTQCGAELTEDEEELCEYCVDAEEEEDEE